MNNADLSKAVATLAAFPVEGDDATQFRDAFALVVSAVEGFMLMRSDMHAIKRQSEKVNSTYSEAVRFAAVDMHPALLREMNALYVMIGAATDGTQATE